MRGFTRRQFLKAAGVGAGCAWLGGAGLARGAAPTFTGVTYLTPAYENSFPIIMGFVDQLKKHPDLFAVDFFDSGTLVKADEQTAALRAGTIQFMFHTTSYITRTFPDPGDHRPPQPVQPALSTWGAAEHGVSPVETHERRAGQG